MDAKVAWWTMLLAGVAIGGVRAEQPGESDDPPPVTAAAIAARVHGMTRAPRTVPDEVPTRPWLKMTGNADKPVAGADVATSPAVAVYVDTGFAPTPVQQAAGWKAARPKEPALLPEMPQGGTKAELLAATAQTREDLTAVIAACREAGAGGVATDAIVREPPWDLLAWAYNRRGELALDADNASLALPDFSRAIEVDELSSAAWLNRGVARAVLGRLAEAVEDFSRVIELDPASSTAYRNRGEALLGLGEHKRAVFDFTAAIALGPVEASLLVARGYAYQLQGEIDLAIADLNLALQLEPGDAKTLAHRGNIYALATNYRQAARDFVESLRINPDDAATRRSYAWMLATCPEAAFRNPAEAARQAEQAVQMAIQRNQAAAQKDAEAWNTELALHLDTLAVALAAGERFKQAVHYQQQAVQLAPNTLREPLQERLALFTEGAPFRSPEIER